MKKGAKKASLEQQARNRRHRTSIENVVLSTLAVAGITTFALMAPNAMRLLKHVDLDWVGKRDPRQRLQECMSRMKSKGLVRVDQKTRRYALTEKGASKARRISLHEPIPAPKRWDGRWRIVMFDIAEKRRSLRLQLRRTISQLGFYRMQDSVWVHPSDCEEIVALLKLEKRIGAELRYVIADAIEYDKPLREYFRLPLR